MFRFAASLLLLIAAAAGMALAQTPGPTPGQIVSQQQAYQNQFQAQLQANQLQQLQRRNNATLSSPGLSSPGAEVQAEAMVQRREIQQQIDQNAALQQRMTAPGSNPTDLTSQLQQYSADIQQMQRQQAPLAP